jgi:hypothetical protein
MWVIMFNAVDDFGIREENELLGMGQSPPASPEYETVEKAKQQLYDEALHGALRIAGLVSSKPSFHCIVHFLINEI